MSSRAASARNPKAEAMAVNKVLNRPVVLTMARVDSLQRVIPAERVREVEQIAATATSAGKRIDEAEAQCRSSIDRKSMEAWQRGFAQGHAEALRKLKDFIVAVDTRRKAVDAELLALVDEAVRRIVRNVPAQLLTESAIETALSEAQSTRGRFVLRVHPDLTGFAENFLSRVRAPGDQMQVVVEGDAAMAYGDCTLETPAGTIDAGLSTQLAALRSVLDGASRDPGAQSR
jgi:type III secretion protein L